jgi:hypothetical protein
MADGMKRHEGKESPEAQSPAASYGSAIHLCLEMLDDGATPDQAAQAAFARYAKWLEPSDLTLLMEDMERYLEREILGVRTLLNEGEISVPLFVHPTAGPVWFRARIDRLYQSIEDPARLIQVDYKSSKHAKSHEEVAKDIQQWGYNFIVHAWFEALYPEVENVYLEQIYDQLRYGQIPTQKSAAQREQIKQWLIKAITAVIDDEEMLPSFNTWCGYCHLRFDCPVVQYELTDWATARISALMPREEKLKKDGSVSKLKGPVVLDRDRIREYVDLLPQVKSAKTVLESFDKEVTDVLKDMPTSSLAELGRKKTERSVRVFSPEAKRQIIEEVGLGTALMLFDLSLESVKRFFGDDTEMAEKIASLAEKQPAYTVIDTL